MQLRFAGTFAVDAKYARHKERGQEKAQAVQDTAKEKEVLEAIRSLPEDVQLAYSLETLYASNGEGGNYAYLGGQDEITIMRKHSDGRYYALNPDDVYSRSAYVTRRSETPERKVTKGMLWWKKVVDVIPAQKAESVDEFILRAVERAGKLAQRDDEIKKVSLPVE